jgi:hypothetical protein
MSLEEQELTVCTKRDIASKPCNFCENVLRVCVVNLRQSVRIFRNYIAELLSQSPRHFARQHSAPVFKPYGAPTSVTWLQLLRMQTEYWHLHCSESRNTLINARTNSHTLPNCDTSLGSPTLLAPEAGDFVELILVYPSCGNLPITKTELAFVQRFGHFIKNTKEFHS